MVRYTFAGALVAVPIAFALLKLTAPEPGRPRYYMAFVLDAPVIFITYLLALVPAFVSGLILCLTVRSRPSGSVGPLQLAVLALLSSVFFTSIYSRLIGMALDQSWPFIVAAATAAISVTTLWPYRGAKMPSNKSLQRAGDP